MVAWVCALLMHTRPPHAQNPGLWTSFTSYLHAVVTEIAQKYAPQHWW